MVDTIDKWDESKLEEVVQKKHGGKTKPKTDIVSGCLFLHLLLYMHMYVYINTVHCFFYIHDLMDVHVITMFVPFALCLCPLIRSANTFSKQ